jgi:hypothetical protein
MTDGAESLLRLKKLLPVPTRLVLDYFRVAMKVRHADQCIGRIPPYRFSPNGSVFELYDRFNYLRGYLRATAKAVDHPPEPTVGAPDPDPTDTSERRSGTISVNRFIGTLGPPRSSSHRY